MLDLVLMKFNLSAGSSPSLTYLSVNSATTTRGPDRLAFLSLYVTTSDLNSLAPFEALDPSKRVYEVDRLVKALFVLFSSRIILFSFFCRVESFTPTVGIFRFIIDYIL
jgi:hypothetical protein